MHSHGEFETHSGHRETTAPEPAERAREVETVQTAAGWFA